MPGYHVVHKDDVETALKYPMDYRRYRSSEGGSYVIPEAGYASVSNGNQPKFFQTPREAFITGLDNGISKTENIKILICRVISSSSEMIITDMQWDYLPMYIVSMVQIIEVIHSNSIEPVTVSPDRKRPRIHD